MKSITPSTKTFTLILGALSAIPPLCIDMALPALPAIEGSFGTAMNQAALTLGIFLLGFGLSPLLAGPALDRYGRRAMTLIGLAILAIGALGCSFALTFAGLLFFRFVQGVGGGICVVAPIAMIRDAYEGAQARTNLSRISAILGIAPIVAPVIGGAILAFGGWRAIFAVQAIAATLLSALVRGMEETLKPELRQLMTPGAILQSYRQVLSNKTFRKFTLVFALSFAGLFTYISSSATVFTSEFGIPQLTFSWVFALTAIGMLAGFITSGRKSDQGVASLKLVKLGVAAAAVISLQLLVLSTTGLLNVWVAVPILAGGLFCFGLAAPGLTHEALQELPNFAGAASGISRSVQMGFGSLASALAVGTMVYVGPSAAMTGLMSIFTISAAFVLLCIR